MHKKSASVMIPTKAPVLKSNSTCPYTPSDVSASSTKESPSFLFKLNPLNYMYSDLSQEPAPNQKINLPTTRDSSSIPKASGNENWEYPSPQQMYNALLRKGYTDTDPTAVESMVSVHNFLNEGAWAEVTEWERRFAGGIAKGWVACKRGEAGSMASQTIGANVDEVPQPRLVRFKGRPQEMTPKAALFQLLGKVHSKFQTEPPFDRHDWYVQRRNGNTEKEIRYVIDYYSAPDDEHGNPVFHLDVRPAIDTPTQAVERLMRSAGDIWYRASGVAAAKES